MATETKRKDRPDVLAGDKYFNLIEHAADGIAIIQDGVFKLVNTALTRISGYDKEELLGMLFTELLTPASQKLTLERYQARLAGKKVPQIYEVQAVTKDGQIRDIELNAALTEYDGRAADEVIARDITERKKIENKIKKTEQEKTDILNSMSEIVIFQDLEHRMLWVNKIASESAGLTHEQMLGRYCYEVWSQRNKPCVGCPVQKARQTGKPQKAEIATPDGRLWSISGYPMRDENGVITGMLEVALDITERKKAEQELQTERNKLQSVIGAIEYALTIQDKDYNIMYQNEASRISSSGSRIGEKCYRVYEGRDKVCDGCPVKKAFKDGKSHTAERQRLSSSGEITFWENTANPITDASGKIVSCLEIGRNITDRKKAEQALADETTRRRILIDQSRDGIVILDQNGKVYEANQQFAEMLGYTPEETAKLHVWDWEYLYPREQVMEMLRTVDEAGDHFETRHRRKDGSVYDVEISTNGTMFAGQKLIFCVCRDITERKKTEQALRESEERYRTVIEGAHDMIQSVALDGSIDFVNQAWLDTLGYTKADLPKLNLVKVIHPDSLPHCRELFAKVVKGKPANNMQTAFLTKDGREILVEGNAAPRYIGDKVVATQGIFRDITDRKRMEKQLQEKNEELDAQNEELKAINEELQATEEELQHSQERLERMFESVTDGIVVTTTDGTILKVNQSVVQMHGFTSEDEILGKNVTDLVAPGDREKIGNEMLDIQKEGPIRYREYNMLKADGSEFPVEVNTSALKDTSGKVIGHITTGRDITERKQMEKLFKTVTNSSQVGIYIIQDGKFQMANPQFQKLTGYSEEELIGMDSLALVPDEDKDKVREKAIKMLKGELSSPYQFRVVNKPGETRWVMETVSSIPYRGRRAILGNYMDITERRQAEEREDQLQQELNLASRLASIGQLAAGVAHEINNPLTGVIGFSHLMLSRDIPNDMKQDLQVIHSEAQRVAKIVENLLIFAHQRKTGREYVAINDIITRVLELRAYEMKVNNIEVESQLDPDMPSTMADAGQLQQVFLNIILNAEYFMTKAHHKGKLLVKTEKINGNIRASFTDDGAGISPENIDKIFNPFFTTKEVGKGTGLGLSICHGIITQHKGRIYTQSQLGKGATFVIELPIVAEPAQAGKTKATKPEPQKPRGAKILVVDDEAAILAFLSRLLSEWGHSVETINNANTALEKLNTERYSLVLLDIKLPGMSGIELYQRIEDIAPALARRVMFITGDIMEGTTRAFLEKTGSPYITKPLDIEVLKKTINRALNQTQVTAKAAG
jgi:PAS domain S-box-containing protein